MTGFTVKAFSRSGSIIICFLFCFQRAPGFDIKEGTEAWRTLAAQSGGCFPYDPSLAIYPYGTG